MGKTIRNRSSKEPQRITKKGFSDGWAKNHNTNIDLVADTFELQSPKTNHEESTGYVKPWERSEMEYDIGGED